MAIYYENGLWLGLFRDDFCEGDLRVEEKQIQVRQGWWRQRCGDVVHVKRDADDSVHIRTYYPWNCKDHNYTDSGRMDVDREYDVDLVEFLHDNETLEIWNSDSNGVTLTECLNLLREYAERNLPED